jgi:hypothetical protein
MPTPLTELSRMPTTLYRLVTGPDDASFCHRVSEALSLGWQLYGTPSLTYDADQKKVICGQGITKNVKANYSADMKLSEQ